MHISKVNTLTLTVVEMDHDIHNIQLRIIWMLIIVTRYHK